MMIPEDVKKRFESIEDPISFFKDILFPQLKGDPWDDVRTAVLLQLVSGDTVKRGRIHILLWGPPGTGKTEALLWMRSYLGVVFVCQHTTDVGLIGNAQFGEFQPGVLAEADGSIIAIDELDKFRPRDLYGLLEAMEEGEYRVVKGRHKLTVSARVRVIGATNDLGKLPRPLVDRFDFVFRLSIPDREERAEAVPEIVDSFFEEEEDFGCVLRAYAEYVSEFKPRIIDKEAIVSEIQNFVRDYSVPVEKYSYRSLELSILRIAYALAKFERKDLDINIVRRAIELKRRCLE